MANSALSSKRSDRARSKCLASKSRALFTGLAVGLFPIYSQTALSQSRPVTTTMRCQAVLNLVTARGDVVLGTGTYTYDRYVSSSAFCPIGQATDPAWVPTADQPQCYIGFRCRGVSQGPSGR
jgi:hypothetical protein